MKKTVIFKGLLVLLAVCLGLSSLVSCSSHPEYAEIEPRLKELVEASYEINSIFFGEGLPTYERVYDPKSSTEVIEVKDTDSEGAEISKKVWYYYTEDTENRVIAYRDSYLKPFIYALRSAERISEDELKARFPLADGENGEGYYSQIYEDTTQGIFCYSIPYAEKTYDLYYTESDPKEYDYVKFDAPYKSINEIKAVAEKVYSAEYLDAVYQTMFVGTTSIENTSGLNTLSARYSEKSDEYGSVVLMKSNTYEPLISEKRLYNFDSAEIVRKSNKNYLTIEIDSYLESSPDKILRIKLTMSRSERDGKWYLDSATY